MNLPNFRKNFAKLLFGLLALLVVQVVPASDKQDAPSGNYSTPGSLKPLPFGTNFGGIFVLEDWFFSGALTNYEEYRNYVLSSQLKAANANNIEMFFWTWKLPYNRNFHNEWSLYHILKISD